MWSSLRPDLARAGVALALTTLGACADAGAAIDLELVVDPNVAPRDQVLAEVALYRVVLDSADGLYRPGEESVLGDMEIADFDGDPDDLELVVRVSALDARLPWIRIRRGGLPDVPLEIRVIGYDLDDESGVPVAEGILRGVRFGSGIDRWQMPFDLRPERLPPRVEEAVVGDGTGMGCGLPSVVVLFSKPVDRASLEAPGSVIFAPGGAPSEMTLDQTGRIAVLTAPSAVVSAQGYAFTVTLATSIVDDEGRPLDQVPTLEGPQPFQRAAMAPCRTPGGLLGGM